MPSMRIAACALVLLSTCSMLADPCRAAEDSAPPAVGDQARSFELEALDGTKVKLDELTKQGPVVLVVLRGYPGYQCPICSKQVASLLQRSGELAEAGAHVVFVYPGAANQLNQRATEFVGKRELPEHFHFVTDPDYSFTNAYHLRWDANRETAYPSTFVIDTERVIRYAKISKTHGGRAPSDELLKAVADLKS